MIDKAKEYLYQHGTLSEAFLMRKLKITFTEAKNIIDEMAPYIERKTRKTI